MTWRNPYSQRFDGKGDFISLPNSKDWDLKGVPDCYTLDFWMKPTLWQKIRGWFGKNIYHPIRKIFKPNDYLVCWMKATSKMEMERIAENLTDEEIRILYDILWHKIHNPEDFIGGND